jgi:hypothetical protein
MAQSWGDELVRELPNGKKRTADYCDLMISLIFFKNAGIRHDVRIILSLSVSG